MKTFKPKPYKFPFYIRTRDDYMIEFYINDYRHYVFYKGHQIWRNLGTNKYTVEYMCDFNGTLEEVKEFIYNDYRRKYK
jgi:hypothetical protein